MSTVEEVAAIPSGRKRVLVEDAGGDAAIVWHQGPSGWAEQWLFE